ncbi:transglycosylase SLT domain-containing protein [Uliginosibacterium sp. H1]|uniref:transglycosylase SLT domain-containing protein n=1 Tax=Uliginosibacterium sp. H1 TaxID=3114757 RepID=UPI002E18CFCB|nr:transglycosylase SLT domain-containing protein [Uliginosibacterium sp. H1]
MKPLTLMAGLFVVLVGLSGCATTHPAVQADAGESTAPSRPAASPASIAALASPNDRNLGLDTELRDPQMRPAAATVIVPLAPPLKTIATRDLTVEAPDIWARIRRGFGMQNLYGPLVDDRQQWYLARPQALTVMFERSRKYLYHVVMELEKRGMPTELALLPLVESAYNPNALSSAKAAGLWQFIPSTGKSFQLAQNFWVDERRDIMASTDAALTYLQAIYEMHGDWHLALASYNWGENAVARAVNNNRAAGLPVDFNSLRMPNETRYYVPKLQALKNIILHAEQYHVSLPAIPNTPYFVTVPRQDGMDVALAARLAEMPLTEFRELNPSYNRPVIPGHSDAPLLLPISNAQRFEANLAQHNSPLMSWRTYSVPKAERVEQVAQRLRVPVDTLRTANSLPPRARLRAGYTLLVPAQAQDLIASAPVSPSERKATTPSAKTQAKGKQATRSASKKAPAKQAKAPARKPPVRVSAASDQRG